MIKRKIYAVDFDGTLCKNAWPEIGKPNKAMIKYCIKKKSQGHKIILWTCRSEDKLQNAVDWCYKQGIEFDAVNDNIPEMLELFNSNSRKVFASYYIDDKNKGYFKLLIWKLFKK